MNAFARIGKWFRGKKTYLGVALQVIGVGAGAIAFREGASPSDALAVGGAVFSLGTALSHVGQRDATRRVQDTASRIEQLITPLENGFQLKDTVEIGRVLRGWLEQSQKGDAGENGHS